MTTGEMIHRAIIEEPQENLHRLKYADWLQEHAGLVDCPLCRGRCAIVLFRGPGATKPYHTECPTCDGSGSVSDGHAERAEFIRIQCELANMHSEPDDGCDDCRKRHELRNREQALLQAAFETIRPTLPGYNPIPLYGVPSNPEIGAASLVNVEKVNFVIRRGFVAEARMPLSAFLGGECQPCRILRQTVGTGDYGCTICNGTRKARGCAAGLFQAHPIELVVETTRAPVVQDDGVKACWFSEEATRGLPGFEDRPDSNLPQDLLDKLTGCIRSQCGGCVTYQTETLAHNGLSRALVAHGRAAAGLPALAEKAGAV